MKTTIQIIAAAMLLVFAVSCDRTDFDEILCRQADQQEQLDDHEARLKALEELVKKANEDLATISELIDILNGKVSIVSYKELADGSGYELTMSDGSKIILSHGSSPVVSVAEHTDGLLYWTLGGEWMRDGSGNMILAQGLKGDTGETGATGQTPQMRVNGDNHWEVSLDGGTTWQEVKDGDGDPVPATGATGPAGETGAPGEPGEGGKSDLTITEDGAYIIITYGGNTYVVPTKLVIPESATVPFAAGEFWMGNYEIVDGSPVNLDVNNYSIRHLVQLTLPFRIMKYEVTNAQYARFLNEREGTFTKYYKILGNNGITMNHEAWIAYADPINGDFLLIDSRYRSNVGATQGTLDNSYGLWYDDATGKWAPVPGYGDLPVTFVTYWGAKAFAEYVGGSLPTEAQWEYACRAVGYAADPETIYSFGNNAATLGTYAWSYSNSGGRPQPVGGKTANPAGLYDMYGNAQEWTADLWNGIGDYTIDPVYSGNPDMATVDPKGLNSVPSSFKPYIVRGGSFLNMTPQLRSGYRASSQDQMGNRATGFRVIFYDE